MTKSMEPMSKPPEALGQLSRLPEVAGWRFVRSCVDGWWLAVRTCDLSSAMLARGLAAVMCGQDLLELAVRVREECEREHYARTFTPRAR